MSVHNIKGLLCLHTMRLRDTLASSLFHHIFWAISSKYWFLDYLGCTKYQTTPSPLPKKNGQKETQSHISKYCHYERLRVQHREQELLLKLVPLVIFFSSTFFVPPFSSLLHSFLPQTLPSFTSSLPFSCLSPFFLFFFKLQFEVHAGQICSH